MLISMMDKENPDLLIKLGITTDIINDFNSGVDTSNYSLMDELIRLLCGGHGAWSGHEIFYTPKEMLYKCIDRCIDKEKYDCLIYILKNISRMIIFDYGYRIILQSFNRQLDVYYCKEIIDIIHRDVNTIIGLYILDLTWNTAIYLLQNMCELNIQTRIMLKLLIYFVPEDNVNSFSDSLNLLDIKPQHFEEIQSTITSLIKYNKVDIIKILLELDTDQPVMKLGMQLMKDH